MNDKQENERKEERRKKFWFFAMKHLSLTKKGRRIVMPALAFQVIYSVLLAGYMGNAWLLLFAVLAFYNVLKFNKGYNEAEEFRKSIGWDE